MWWGWGSSSTDLQIPSSYPTRWMDPVSVLFSFTSSKARGLTLISLPLRPLYLKPPLPSPLIFLYNSDCDIQATHDNPSGSLGNNTDPCSHSKSIEFKRLGMTPPRPSTSREYQDGGTEPYLLRLCVELITSAFAPHPRLVPQFLLLLLFFLSLSDHKNTIFTVLPPLFKSPRRPHHNNKSLNEQMNAFPDTQ